MQPWKCCMEKKDKKRKKKGTNPAKISKMQSMLSTQALPAALVLNEESNGMIKTMHIKMEWIQG